MGCYYYPTHDADGKEIWIHFSEGDEDTSCLCTLAQHFEDAWSPGYLRSLAYLGAAVVLAKSRPIEGGYIFLSHDLPEDWKRTIDEAIPVPD